MSPELGIIEGFFGRPWSWAERADAVRFLRPHGFSFYLYAPKADPYLRRRWQEPHPAAEMFTGVNNFARDKSVFQNLSVIVDVLEKKIHRRNSLRQAALDRLPLGGWNNPQQ